MKMTTVFLDSAGSFVYKDLSNELQVHKLEHQLGNTAACHAITLGHDHPRRRRRRHRTKILLSSFMTAAATVTAKTVIYRTVPNIIVTHCITKSSSVFVVSAPSSTSTTTTTTTASRNIDRDLFRRKENQRQRQLHQMTSTGGTSGTNNQTKNSTSIGGGAINEKKRVYLNVDNDNVQRRNSQQQEEVVADNNRGFRSTKYRSHLMHAIEGLDRYPNYLSRWNNEKDVNELESSLQQLLDEVRQQKDESNTIRSRIRLAVSEVSKSHPNLAQRVLFPPETWDDVKTNLLDRELSKAIFRSTQFRGAFNGTVASPSSSTNKVTHLNNETSIAAPSGGMLTVQNVMNGTVDVQLDVGYLSTVMDEEVSDVYSFPLLSTEFCTSIQTFVRLVWEHLDGNHNDDDHHPTSSTSTIPTTTAGGSNNNDDSVRSDRRYRMMLRDLDCLGLSWLNDLLFHLIVRPISRHLFQETEINGYNNNHKNNNVRQKDNNNGGDSDNHIGGELDWRHGFIASYSANPSSQLPRQRLVPHTDDSEVTLNVCLGDVFDGGDLRFWGYRGGASSSRRERLFGGITDNDDDEELYTPKIGRAILHAGRQLHEVTDVTNGDRIMLIMWTRSWNGVRSTTCPCCWLNGRTDSSCVCGTKWN